MRTTGCALIAAAFMGFFACGTVQARIAEPVHGGTPCVNACKEPWRVCFRDVCFATPGYKNAPGLKRAAIEKIAKQKCAGEWSKFRACKKRCKAKASLQPLRLLAQLAPKARNYCSL